jgi:hypothetical protein
MEITVKKHIFYTSSSLERSAFRCEFFQTCYEKSTVYVSHMIWVTQIWVRAASFTRLWITISASESEIKQRAFGIGCFIRAQTSHSLRNTSLKTNTNF